MNKEWKEGKVDTAGDKIVLYLDLSVFPVPHLCPRIGY